jgi:hypothetical protein
MVDVFMISSRLIILVPTVAAVFRILEVMDTYLSLVFSCRG